MSGRLTDAEPQDTHNKKARVKSTWFLDLEIFSYTFPHAPRYIGIGRICSSQLQCGKSATSKIGVTPYISSLSYHLILIAKQYSWQICHFTQVANLPHFSHLGYKPKFGYIVYFGQYIITYLSYIQQYTMWQICHIRFVADLPHVKLCDVWQICHINDGDKPETPS